MKFAPFKPCTLPKHVRVEILHREFPVKNLYFPCKGLQCCQLSNLKLPKPMVSLLCQLSKKGANIATKQGLSWILNP